MSKEKNLMDPKVAEDIKKGIMPGTPACKVYKHPIKNREIVVSKGQQKGIKNG